ncbi:MAG: prephenate dehydrogenase/arogenate dehydrogenase family protein [Deltaproteobacteria bacterium]
MGKIEIGIIGGTRGMGKWLAHFFQSEGLTVHISGRSSGMSPKEMARICQVIVIAVPIAETINTIKKVGAHMRTGSLLMDVTSLKEKEVATMLIETKADVIGCHPLFGPRIRSLKGRNVILCPAKGKRWIAWIETMLIKHGAFVTKTTPKNHDEMMALVQVLNHFNTISMGVALSNTGVSFAQLEPYITPVFETKVRLIKKIFSK